MKIIFFGSDDFALAHLQALIDAGQDVAAIVTQPDRPRDRGMKTVVSPLKERALDAGIKLFQPEDLKGEDFVAALRDVQADIFVVVSYGRFLPPVLLEIPSQGAINVHGSLLPQYRGAAPINWAIINGETETGLTIFRLNPQMDAGDILAQVKVPIAPDETSLSLREKMKRQGTVFLLDTLGALDSGHIGRIVQEDQFVSYAPKLTRELGKIDWKRSAIEIDRLVRGLFPSPGAYTCHKKETLKILSVTVLAEDIPAAVPGQVVLKDRGGLVVQTGNGCLQIERLQLASGKPMDTGSFLRGHDVGTHL